MYLLLKRHDELASLIVPGSPNSGDFNRNVNCLFGFGEGKVQSVKVDDLIDPTGNKI